MDCNLARKKKYIDDIVLKKTLCQWRKKKNR